MVPRPLTVVQMLPALDAGGVERGTVELAGFLVAQGHRSIVISAGGRMLAQLRAAGSEHLDWDVGAKRLGTLRWIPRLRRFLAETRPDILHLRSRLPAWIGYWAWRGLPPERRPHLVTTVHGPYTVGRYSSVMTRGERVIAVSETIREYILRNYSAVNPARVRVIHRGVDPLQYPHGFQPAADWLRYWRSQYPHLSGSYVVTLPARLTRWKGQEDFLRIIAALRAGGVPVQGLLVGAAHPRRQAYATELEALAGALGVAEWVTFAGHRADLREVMAVSDVVLSLSLEPEAFGRTTIEALSLGRPVAGYDHGGVGEQLAAVLPQGRVPVGDVTAMVELLRRWYREPPPVPAEHPFTLERMLKATLDVYRELVDEP